MEHSDKSSSSEQGPDRDASAGRSPSARPAGGATASSPEVVTKRRRRISWIWLVPLVAALVGMSLVVNKWMNTGPMITISFDSAEGLEVGQTKIRYKNVVVGVVKDISVSKDRSHVLVKARLNHDGADYITKEGTKFWVVRPRLGVNGISGLGTLVSGAFIGVDTDKADEKDGEHVYTFTGLEKPPEITDDKPGTRFTLVAPDLGSLSLGSPVYFRQIQVGRVVDYDLTPDGKNVNIQIFVESPDDKFVTADTRFWNDSGVNLSLDADGFSFHTGSLASVISGGIAFATKAKDGGGEKAPAPADPNTVFLLKNSREEAMEDPKGPAVDIDMLFHQSVRGLKVGASVDFQGLQLGTVTDIRLKFDRANKEFYVLVKAKLYPRRSIDVYRNLMESYQKSSKSGLPLAPLIQHGLRAQLRVGNLLTGQQYIALDFFPKAKPVEFDETKRPLQIPTVSGNFDKLQEQITDIVGKLSAIPYAGISQDLRDSLKSITKLADELRKNAGPQTTATLKSLRKSLRAFDDLMGSGSQYDANLAETLAELSQAAKSLRALADYLQAHPSSLLRGHAPDVLPSGH